jgi:hypothetical protein
VTAKVRERLLVRKQEHMFDAETFNLKELSELEVSKRYQIEISDKFAALENLNDSEDINSPWETIKGNIKISAKGRPGLYECKQCKLWFDVEYSTKVSELKASCKNKNIKEFYQGNSDLGGATNVELS